jgi:putative molybdopterin biosynthesis protein
MAARLEDPPRFMSVKQVADYLHLNEKKVYTLVSEGKIPGTKVTGKWMFPRELIDRWILESSHGGLLTDRLLVAGSDDPLLSRVILKLAQDTQAKALLSFTSTGTRLGLELLQAHRADASCLRWGPKREAHLRHPALLRQYPHHRRWILVRAFSREQGLIVHPGVLEKHGSADDLLRADLRWSLRQNDSGAQRFLIELLGQTGLSPEQLNRVETALSERESAASVAMGRADAAPGARAVATEYGLGFVPTGWESFDLVLDRGIYFRSLFQELIARLKSETTAELASNLGGYDLAEAGRLVWGQD